MLGAAVAGTAAAAFAAAAAAAAAAAFSRVRSRRRAASHMWHTRPPLKASAGCTTPHTVHSFSDALRWCPSFSFGLRWCPSSSFGLHWCPSSSFGLHWCPSSSFGFSWCPSDSCACSVEVVLAPTCFGRAVLALLTSAAGRGGCDSAAVATGVRSSAP